MNSHSASKSTLETCETDDSREEWRHVVGMGGRYAISSRGRVRREAPGAGAIAGRSLTTRKQRTGYIGVMLHVAGRSRHFLVHRLVAAAFIGPCPAGMEVNHKDFDRANNAASNLEYLTPSENRRHSVRAGRWWRARITPEQALAIRQSDEDALVLAGRYGISRQQIYKIRGGRQWRIHELALAVEVDAGNLRNRGGS